MRERLFLSKPLLVEKLEDVAAIFQGRHVLDGDDDPVRGEERVLGEDVEIGAGIDDEYSRYPGGGEEAGQDQRAFEGLFEFVQGF